MRLKERNPIDLKKQLTQPPKVTNRFVAFEATKDFNFGKFKNQNIGKEKELWKGESFAKV